MEKSSEGALVMDTEVKKVPVLGNIAIGAIEPKGRVEAGEISDTTVDLLAEQMSQGRQYEEIDVDPGVVNMLIPKWCVDGRSDPDSDQQAPNAAGGTYSLVVAEALIDAEILVAQGKTSVAHSKEMFEDLTSNGYDIGGHTDDHATTEKCGCGACDRMAEIISFIADKADEISEISATLGVEVSQELIGKIKAGAELLIENKYVSTGPEMIQNIKDVTKDESHVQTVRGPHNEVVLGINTKVGTTLDRGSITNEFGEQYQAFNLDVWALENGIKAIESNEDLVNEKFVAGVFYNIATAAVLAGPSLRVVVNS
ncbi:hypothetical protein KDA08_03720 [Candidatus Saccharibacteria bacterium]|nr:hypothetical protein [Candidatus Saccharibacteria bacterium]MCA9313399.1 hypothetical protein [Candidatus Saccharibacteria bacterium]